MYVKTIIFYKFHLYVSDSHRRAQTLACFSQRPSHLTIVHESQQRYPNYTKKKHKKWWMKNLNTKEWNEFDFPTLTWPQHTPTNNWTTVIFHNCFLPLWCVCVPSIECFSFRFYRLTMFEQNIFYFYVGIYAMRYVNYVS